MALIGMEKVVEIDPTTGKKKSILGLRQRECGTYVVKSGAITKKLADYEYSADFMVNGKRFRTVLCRASDFASETVFNSRSGEWDSPAQSRAKEMLEAYRKNAKDGTGPTRRQEERRLTRQQREVKEEADRQREARESQRNKTVADLVKKYHPFLKAKVKPSSYASFKGHLERIETELGGILLRDLTLERVEELQAALKTTPRVSRKKKVTAKKKTDKPSAPPAPLSTLTVNRHIQTLKAMMTKACDWGWITERRLREIRKIEMGDEKDRRRMDFLSREEAERLIEAADPPIRPIIICALQTGMRKGEILSLRWRNVDLTHRVIHLSKTKSGEPRSLPINDRLFEVLQSNTLLRSLEDDHVFLNPEPRTIGEKTAEAQPKKTVTRWSDLKTPFARAVRKAKLEHRGIVFHHLRHTAASWMVMAGVPLLTVARILGHADIQMVSRYSHLSPEHMGAAVAVLDGSTPAQETPQETATEQQKK